MNYVRGIWIKKEEEAAWRQASKEIMHLQSAIYRQISLQTEPRSFRDCGIDLIGRGAHEGVACSTQRGTRYIANAIETTAWTPLT